MKTYTFPRHIRKKRRKKTVYIKRNKGLLVYNCDPKEATEIKVITVGGLWKWPLSVLIQVRGPGEQLLDVLFYCGYWFHSGHDVYIYWNGLFCGRFKCLKHFQLPYRWWAWKVLTRSKKLVWKTKTMWAERAVFPQKITRLKGGDL